MEWINQPRIRSCRHIHFPATWRVDCDIRWEIRSWRMRLPFVRFERTLPFHLRGRFRTMTNACQPSPGRTALFPGPEDRTRVDDILTRQLQDAHARVVVGS